MGRNHHIRTITVAAMALLLGGCGLSKSKAREILEAENYAKDSNVYCKFSEFNATGSGTGKIYESYVDANYCVWALGRAGVLDAPPCRDRKGGVCGRAPFRLNSEAEHKEGKIFFPCGTKKLGEVDSVTTEGNKARVKYKRTVTLDQPKLDQLSSCTLKIPTAGEEDLTIEFTKDDDGKWTSL